MHCYLDIETIPTQSEAAIARIAETIKPPAQMKKAETIAEWEKTEKPQAILDALKKTALDGAYGQIVCTGYAFDDGEIIKVYGKDEAQILRLFFDDLAEAASKTHTGITFVGHNLTTFDMRFIFHRAVINGVKPPSCFPINPKSWDASLFDTMTYWAGHGNRISLDNLCFALGLEGKPDNFTWEDVLPAYLSGDFESIAAYCANDVDKVRQVHKKLTFNV